MSPAASRLSARPALLGFTASVLLTACPCDTGFQDLFADEIHRTCDGLPCDWDLVSGQARLVPFLHRGERALEIASGSVLTRALPDLTLFTPIEDGIQFYVLAACESGTELVFELQGIAADESPHSYTAELALGFGSGGILPRRTLPLTLQGQAPSSDRVVFDTLTLTVEGPGRCTLDDLHITSNISSTCF